MSLPVVFRPEAARDAEDTRDYLEGKATGLGQTFLTRLGEALAQVQKTPELYAAFWKEVRAFRLRKFAYVLYYRVLADRIEVLAVMHGSRDSSSWQDRIERPSTP